MWFCVTWGRLWGEAQRDKREEVVTGVRQHSTGHRGFFSFFLWRKEMGWVSLWEGSELSAPGAAATAVQLSHVGQAGERGEMQSAEGRVSPPSSLSAHGSPFLWVSGWTHGLRRAVTKLTARFRTRQPSGLRQKTKEENMGNSVLLWELIQAFLSVPHVPVFHFLAQVIVWGILSRDVSCIQWKEEAVIS